MRIESEAGEEWPAFGLMFPLHAELVVSAVRGFKEDVVDVRAVQMSPNPSSNLVLGLGFKC